MAHKVLKQPTMLKVGKQTKTIRKILENTSGIKLAINQISISKASPGGIYNVHLLVNVPIVEELAGEQLTVIRVWPRIPTAPLHTWFTAGGDRTSTQHGNVLFIISARASYRHPRPIKMSKGTYDIYATGQIWHGKKKSKSGYIWYGADPIYSCNFGKIGELVVR